MGTLGLLTDRDFRRFWIGQTISVFGSSVSEFALPLTAILVLGTSAWQMGLLQAAAGMLAGTSPQ